MIQKASGEREKRRKNVKVPTRMADAGLHRSSPVFLPFMRGISASLFLVVSLVPAGRVQSGEVKPPPQAPGGSLSIDQGVPVPENGKHAAEAHQSPPKQIIVGIVDTAAFVAAANDRQVYLVFSLRGAGQYILDPALNVTLLEGMEVEIETTADRSAIKNEAIDFHYKNASVVSSVKILSLEVEIAGRRERKRVADP